MKMRLFVMCGFVVSLALVAQSDTLALQPTLPPASRPMATTFDEAVLGQLPVQFEVNEGQADAAARFLAHGRGYNLLLTPYEVVLGLLPSAARLLPAVVRLQFVGAAPEPELVGLDRLPGVVKLPRSGPCAGAHRHSHLCQGEVRGDLPRH